MREVAVVGSGIIGTTAALSIQKRLPYAKVTIFTKDLSPNTTSDVAAGLWEPFFLGNTSEDNITKWSEVTYKQLLKWWREGEAQKYGISCHPFLFFTDEKHLELPKWYNFTLGTQRLPEKVIREMSQRYKLKLEHGFTFLTFLWESTIALPVLYQEFKQNGGKIVRTEIKNLNELSSYDVVVNCTGLAAKDLVDDNAVGPIRGQIQKVEAPWQFHTKVMESHVKFAYIIPGTHVCTLGGTATKSSDQSVNDTDKENIERNCSDISPSLRGAKILRNVVGFRPGRDEVRLEVETIQGKPNLLKVVHNYGHGGSGITLSLGCAEETADLVHNILTKHKL